MRVIYSPKHELHCPPKEMVMGRFVDYRETASRMYSILKALNAQGLNDIIPPTDHGLDPILAIHSREYVNYFQTAYAKWLEMGGNPDGVFPDTFAVRLGQIYRDIGDGGVGGRPGLFSYDMTAIIAKETYDAAYEAVQVALTAADCLITGKTQGAFALCRPPGHHSSEDLAGGYCFFNNAGIAAEYLIKVHNVGKIAILDVDYHHGNGTQSIFYERHNPLFVSIHGAPDYPYFWGKSEEMGSGEGLGSNINVPLPQKTADMEYLAALDNVIVNHIIPFGAQILVISLGVDTFCGDPIGSFNLTGECFHKIGQRLGEIGLKTVFVMEGGYNVDEIGINVTNVLVGFDDAVGATAIKA